MRRRTDRQRSESSGSGPPEAASSLLLSSMSTMVNLCAWGAGRDAPSHNVRRLSTRTSTICTSAGRRVLDRPFVAHRPSSPRSVPTPARRGTPKPWTAHSARRGLTALPAIESWSCRSLPQGPLRLPRSRPVRSALVQAGTCTQMTPTVRHSRPTGVGCIIVALDAILRLWSRTPVACRRFASSATCGRWTSHASSSRQCSRDGQTSRAAAGWPSRRSAAASESSGGSRSSPAATRGSGCQATWRTTPPRRSLDRNRRLPRRSVKSQVVV